MLRTDLKPAQGSTCKGAEMAVLGAIFWGEGGNLEGALFEDLLEKEIGKRETVEAKTNKERKEKSQGQKTNSLQKR